MHNALCIVCIHVASERNCFLLTLVRPRSDFPWKPENWLQSETTSVKRCKLASIPESRQHPTEDFKLDENWLSFQNPDNIWRPRVHWFCPICLWLKLDEQPCEARLGRWDIAKSQSRCFETQWKKGVVELTRWKVKVLVPTMSRRGWNVPSMIYNRNNINITNKPR